MSLSRRAFLGSAAALATVRARAMTAARAGPRVSSFDPWVETSPDRMRRNAAEVRRRVQGRPILAVIKNNGYGMGLVDAARALDPLEGVAGFAVVKMQEAHLLRDAGIRKPVLLMGPFEESHLEDAVARGIRPMVYTPVGPLLDRIAARRQKQVPLHLCVDTGIGRVGIPFRRARPLLEDLAGRKSVKVEGTMMTFTEDPDYDREQLRRFRSLCREVEEQGLALGRKHAASSYALFQHADAFMDMVRPGMVLYGIYPEPQFRDAGLLDLQPAIAFKTRVIYTKKLQAGDSAGYNRAYRAEKDVWVATLPVGHADGLPRAAARGALVRIGHALYPVIASVSASHCIVEIGPEPRVEVGDIATVFDGTEGSRPEDFASACGASVYDLTMHLNPLLPRR